MFQSGFCSSFLCTEVLPKISQYASELSFGLRASFHSVSSGWDLKNTKAKLFVLVCFFHSRFFSYYYESTVPTSIYNKAKTIRGLALFSQDHVSLSACVVEITSEVHSCTSLMRQPEPPACCIDLHKLLRKCEASGFLFYFLVIVGNFSKKSRFGLTVISPLGKRETIRIACSWGMGIMAREALCLEQCWVMGSQEPVQPYDVPAMSWGCPELLQRLGCPLWQQDCPQSRWERRTGKAQPG